MMATPAAEPTAEPAGKPTPASAAVSRLRIAAFIGTLALTLLCLAWELWLAPTGRGTLAVKALPLMLALPGLLWHRMYTYRWLSLLVWLYVLEGLVRATSERGLGAALAGAEVALAVAVFCAATFYIRQRLASTVAPPPPSA